MSDTASTPDTDATQLTATVSSTGTTSRNSHEITPELRPHADAVLALDPLNDVPPPYEFPEGWAANLTLRATALPAEQRKEVEARLAALPPEQREAKEPEFTADAVRSLRSQVRVKTGVGKDATPFHREMVAIAREVQDLTDEFNRLGSELARVVRHETLLNPETGEPEAVPVFAVNGPRAAAYTSQQHDILRRMRLLIGEDGYGHEGKRRMDAALHESAVAAQQRANQIEEAAEANKRADQINREQRINARAESLARMRRNGS